MYNKYKIGDYVRVDSVYKITKLPSGGGMYGNFYTGEDINGGDVGMFTDEEVECLVIFPPPEKESSVLGIVVSQKDIPKGCTVSVDDVRVTIKFDNQWYFAESVIAYEKTIQAIRLLAEAKESRDD